LSPPHERGKEDCGSRAPADPLAGRLCDRSTGQSSNEVAQEVFISLEATHSLLEPAQRAALEHVQLDDVQTENHRQLGERQEEARRK
jgi:hypothetical protein